MYVNILGAITFENKLNDWMAECTLSSDLTLTVSMNVKMSVSHSTYTIISHAHSFNQCKLARY